MSEENKEKAQAPKPEEPKQEPVKVEVPKPEAPKQEPVKVEAPKVEEPKQEAPKAEAVKAETPKPEEKTKEKPSNCAACKKSIKKKRYYYRNGKYFCTQRCFKTTIVKASPEAKDAPTETGTK